MKVDHYWGDLIDVSALTESLMLCGCPALRTERSKSVLLLQRRVCPSCVLCKCIIQYIGNELHPFSKFEMHLMEKKVVAPWWAVCL